MEATGVLNLHSLRRAWKLGIARFRRVVRGYTQSGCTRRRVDEWWLRAVAFPFVCWLLGAVAINAEDLVSGSLNAFTSMVVILCLTRANNLYRACIYSANLIRQKRGPARKGADQQDLSSRGLKLIANTMLQTNYICSSRIDCSVWRAWAICFSEAVWKGLRSQMKEDRADAQAWRAARQRRLPGDRIEEEEKRKKGREEVGR